MLFDVLIYNSETTDEIKLHERVANPTGLAKTIVARAARVAPDQVKVEFSGSITAGTYVWHEGTNVAAHFYPRPIKVSVRPIGNEQRVMVRAGR